MNREGHNVLAADDPRDFPDLGIALILSVITGVAGALMRSATADAQPPARF